jgi:cell division protein FtsN
MARSRRTLDRKALREQSDAAERQKPEDEVEEAEGDEDDDEDEDEDEEEEAEAVEAEEEGDEDEDEEARPKKKPKKAPPKPKAPRSRARTPKVTRMKVVWGVFNNSHQVIEEFDYARKKDAEELVAKLTTDKKSGHPFFLQPVKKPIDK